MPTNVCLKDVQQGVESCWDSKRSSRLCLVIDKTTWILTTGQPQPRWGDERAGYQPGQTVQESSRYVSVGIDAAVGVLLPRLSQNKQLSERKLIWTIDEAEIPRQKRERYGGETFGAAEASVAPKSRQILKAAAGPRTHGPKKDDKRRLGYYLTYHW